ncbi:MAG: hypothetical protein FJZ47_24375 [Candidatus Tectomicrobia bacterium]|uniref:Uncharacterized protein n=1 Tax=Tectimicrobiota bacterium TaxID=2528274 RepID=A0A937W839_UNCTE|nr:hypothetical protein [Candidatus Tectomicrobia bacterium]
MQHICSLSSVPPLLIEIDFPRVREKFRTKTIHGVLFPSRHGLRALDTFPGVITGYSTHLEYVKLTP